jgi:hypothetical protein
VEFKTALPTDNNAGGFTSQGTYAPGAYVSAIVWGDIEIRVAAINDANTMTVTSYTSNTWQKTAEIQKVIINSAVAATTLPSMNESLRIYCQPAGGLISEKGSDNGGIDWITMQEQIPVDN